MSSALAGTPANILAAALTSPAGTPHSAWTRSVQHRCASTRAIRWSGRR
ncbi:hypothetical protein KGQ20_29425 [Catenulispora sp. NF23]|nr:hypothetical protein [Catenulispora pinistramenti]MBS2536892.1 hypothetical protein [Catenulispora pinistramenti]